MHLVFLKILQGLASQLVSEIYLPLVRLPSFCSLLPKTIAACSLLPDYLSIIQLKPCCFLCHCCFLGHCCFLCRCCFLLPLIILKPPCPSIHTTVHYLLCMLVDSRVFGCQGVRRSSGGWGDQLACTCHGDPCR